MSRSIRRTLFVALIALATACSGARHGAAPTIDDVRRRAMERPHDPEAQRARAEAELLMRGGDPSSAAEHLAHALEMEDDLGLRLLLGVERELHGHPSEALDAYLDVLARAARSDDPAAPGIAEIAAAEVEALDDAVERYPARVVEALAPLAASPGQLGDGARAAITDLLIDLAYRRADLERVAELQAQQRCVTEWRVAGPIGPRHLLGFDQALAPERDARLADRYDLGPARGQRDTRTVQARGCNAHLGGGPVGGGGTTYAEATITIPETGRWVLRFETPNAAELHVDGERVARLDRRDEVMPRVSHHPMQLEAGEHLVRVKISSRHPNPVLALSASQAAGEPGGGDIEGERLVHEYVRIQRAISRGDVVAAREEVRDQLHADGSPVFLISGAAAALNDPLRSSEVRHDEARRLLTFAADRDPDAWWPRLTLAQLEANEGRDLVAIGAMREGMERWPRLVIFPLQLVDYLESKGWRAQASEAIAAARETVPDACRPRRAALNEARRRSRAADEMEHARALVECDARSDALMSAFARRRQWDEAAEELARLARLEPEESTLGELRARLELAQGRGDEASIAQLITRIQEKIPLSVGVVMMEADRHFAEGDAQAARARIRQALEREPEAMMELRRTLRAMGGESPLEDFRRDGAEVIGALEESGRTYEEPMVLVFDYTVYRVFTDGSMLELTHNIFRLQSQEAVDAMGEFAVPEGAQMLTLQTVKADGTRLEPDEIAGKDTISFPNLSIGDYIEFEYLRAEPSPAGYPRGFLGGRFYFRNYETPFDLSQLTVVTPEDVPLVVDPRGEAPEAEQETHDGLRVHRWTVRESRPFEQEPASIAAREFFPSIAWGHQASWAQYVETLRDVLADRDVRDPAAERLAREIIGDARTTPEQRAARLHRWVLENVEDSNDVFGLAPAMLAARTGNRTRVLGYLMRLAGVETELGLARSYAGDQTEGQLPDDDTYQNLVLRMQGSEGPVWIHAGARGAPFEYVPPVLAGMDALMLTPEAERARLDERDLEADLRTVEVDVDLREDGSARMNVVETFRGSGAVLWRNQLEEIPQADLEQQFESAYVANLIPGAELRRLVVAGREDPEGPMILRYEVEVPGLARQTRGGLTVPPLYRAQLGPQYARVASRDIPQLIPTGLALDVDVRLRVPEGARVDDAPGPSTLESIHGARVEIEAERTEEGLRIQRRYRVPRMRVSPEEYRAFARFARGSDEAESAEIRLSR
ncbi:MAG: DUF3857 domain-containing protein [Sandaracinaceae bacterium]